MGGRSKTPSCPRLSYPSSRGRKSRLSESELLAMPFVRIQKKGQLTLPSQVRSRLGLAEGDLVDVKIRSTNIVITPQMVIDRSKFPTADDEYTPEQRRIINARLDEAEKGPYYGPFKSGSEVARFLKKRRELQRSSKAKKRR